MNRFLRNTAARVAVVAIALCAATARAQILDQVPTDALVVMKIKNLTAVNDKAAALAKQFGLVEMNPAAADPLAALLGAANIAAGVDKGGDAAIILTNGDLDGEIPPVIILVPVSDYKAFIGNFGEAKNEGGIDSFKMKIAGSPDGEETYAANWGKYAAVTPMKGLLDKKPGGFKVNGVTAKELETKDAVTVVNFKVLGPKLTEAIKGHKEELMGEIEKGVAREGSVNAKYLPLIKVVVTQALAVADEFLGDAQAASFSINLSKDGIATSLLTEFEGESYLGKLFSSVQAATSPLMAGLPEAKYLIYGGGINNSEASKKVLDDLLKPIEAELAKTGDDLKPVTTLITALKEATAAQKSQAFGMIAPSGALGASSLLQIVAVTQGDAKTLMGLQQKMAESQQELMALIPNNPSGSMKMTTTPNAKTVDGVSFNQMLTAQDPNDTSPQAMQIKQVFAILYGPGGPAYYTGAVDDQHMLMYAGIDDAMVSAAIKAVKENQDNISKNEGVALVTKNLPEKKIAVIYIAIDEMITTGTNYARMMGMPIPVNLKPNLPPIGVAVATEGPALRIDSFIPADLVEQLITTSLQLRMMGGGRGKPGGL